MEGIWREFGGVDVFALSGVVGWGGVCWAGLASFWEHFSVKVGADSSSQLALFYGTVGYRFSGPYARWTQLDLFEARFQKQNKKQYSAATYPRKWPYVHPNLPRLIYGVAIY